MSSASRVSGSSLKEECKDAPVLPGKRRTREEERVLQVSVLTLGKKNASSPFPLQPQAAEASEEGQKPAKRVFTEAEKTPISTGSFGPFSPQSTSSFAASSSFSPQSNFSFPSSGSIRSANPRSMTCLADYADRVVSPGSSGSDRMTDSSSSGVFSLSPQFMNLTACASPRPYGRSLIRRVEPSLPTTSSAAAALAVSRDSSRPASQSFEPIKEEEGSSFLTAEQESPCLPTRRIFVASSSSSGQVPAVSSDLNPALYNFDIPGDLSPFRSEEGSPKARMSSISETPGPLSMMHSASMQILPSPPLDQLFLLVPRRSSPDLDEGDSSAMNAGEKNHSDSESDDAGVQDRRNGSALSSAQMFSSRLSDSPDLRSESPCVSNLDKSFQSIAIKEKFEESEK